MGIFSIDEYETTTLVRALIEREEVKINKFDSGEITLTIKLSESETNTLKQCIDYLNRHRGKGNEIKWNNIKKID